MIVRDFLDWMRTAPASQRAEATSALARAYLFRSFRRRWRCRRRRDADAARRPFATGAARARQRAGGKPERAAGDHAGARRPISRRSPRRCWRCRRCWSTPIWSMRWQPAAGRCRRRSPVAPDCRVRLPPPSPKSAPRKACLVLLENPDADLAPFSIERIAERHGHLGAIREALLARADVAPATRLTLVAKLSETLGRLCRRAAMARSGSCATHRA